PIRRPSRRWRRPRFRRTISFVTPRSARSPTTRNARSPAGSMRRLRNVSVGNLSASKNRADRRLASRSWFPLSTLPTSIAIATSDAVRSGPNAHAHILAIAAECLALANRRDEARTFVARIRERVPGYSVEDFLFAFRFAADVQKLLRRGAQKIGFDG